MPSRCDRFGREALVAVWVKLSPLWRLSRPSPLSVSCRHRPSCEADRAVACDSA